jgi:hypothetical protein
MIQIFLCHNMHDREWCEWLKARAEELDVKVYMAEHDVRPGENLKDKITKAIDESNAVVALITTNSVNTTFVNQEIGYAISAKKLVIPLVQPGISQDELAMLQGAEYITFDFNRPHEGHAQLTAALQKLVQQQATKQVAKEQRDMALLALACLAVVFLALDS